MHLPKWLLNDICLKQKKMIIEMCLKRRHSANQRREKKNQMHAHTKKTTLVAFSGWVVSGKTRGEDKSITCISCDEQLLLRGSQKAATAQHREHRELCLESCTFEILIAPACAQQYKAT